jgi:hypothetical protein
VGSTIITVACSRFLGVSSKGYCCHGRSGGVERRMTDREHRRGLIRQMNNVTFDWTIPNKKRFRCE